MEETRKKAGRDQRSTVVVKPAGRSPGIKATSGGAVARAVPTTPSPKRAPKPKQSHRTDGLTREDWIRVAAYYRAERRGFAPGHDLEDWFAAEAGLASSVGPVRRGRVRKPTLSA